MDFLKIPADIEEPITHIKVKANDFRGMAKAIGAEYIERVRVGENTSIAMDDMGRMLGRPANVRASRMYPGTIAGDALYGIEAFVGDGVDWISATESELRAAFAKDAHEGDE